MTMVDGSDTSDPLAGKTPAKVVPAAKVAKKAPAKKKAAAKKAPAKKAPAKKAAAKKAPARKKAAAKKAPAKKAAAKKAPAKKAAAKKAPAKKAPAKKKAPAATMPAVPPAEAPTAPPSRDVGRSLSTAANSAKAIIAPIVDAAAPVIPAITRPAAGVGIPDSEPLRSGERRPDRWALCASVPEELLNELVLVAVGGGVALEPLDTSLTLPGMGEVDVRLQLTVNGGQFELRADDGGRARVVVTADGDVQTRSATYEGTVDQAPGLGGPMGVPTPPAPIPVRVEALVHPVLEVHPDHTVTIGLDLSEAELISLQADHDAPVPEHVDPDAWAGILQVFGMVFGMLGPSLFASLGEHVGTVGTDLGPDVGAALVELGVDLGRADVNVASGLISFGLAATDEVRGRAQPVPIAGRRIGIGMANSVVAHLTQKLLERVSGDLPLPFEVDVDLGEQRVGGRVRQSRLLPEPFPDLRTALRTEIRPRLLRGRLELSVQSAWVELPPVLPSFLNQVSRRLGELVSLAPMRVNLPAQLDVPLIPDSTDTIPVEIDDLRVTTNGVGVVVALR